MLMRKVASRNLLIAAYWAVGLYGYGVAFLPTFGVSLAAQKEHALIAAVALGIVGLAFCTPTYHRILMSGNWRARVKSPLLTAVGLVLFGLTLLLLFFYFTETDAQGARNGTRLHALTGLFGYFAGRWIFKK